jgi:o-succinylbenzoate---CoA ligase
MKKINFNSDSPAVLTASHIYSYKEIGGLINSAAEEFRKSGIKEGEITGMLLKNSLQFIITIFALWKIEAVPAPLNLRLSVSEIDEILDDSNIKSVISDKDHSDKVSDKYRCILIDVEALENDKAQSNYDIEIASGGLIIFTSGSSGKPKGVILSSNAIKSSIENSNTVLNQGSDERWLASLPFYHIGGMMIILRSFFFGAAVILPESLRQEDMEYAIENHRPTLASFVSTQLIRFIEKGIKPNPELKNVLVGGGMLEQSLIQTSINEGWKVSPVYGLTETASFVAYLNHDDVKNHTGSSGKSVPPNSIEIIYGSGEEGDTGGEIVIQSPSLFSGYLNNPEETSRRLSSGKYFTGDYGFLDNNGYLYITSRRTDLIVSGGENIDPFEVEEVIKTFPGITDVCVFGKEDPAWGEIVNALIVSDNINSDELTKYLKERIASYKVPKEIIMIDEIPRTDMGKIRRGKIKKMFNP